MKLTSIMLVCALAGGAPSAATADAVADTLHRPALMRRDSAHAALLGIARAGQRLVAVGERGLISLSDDHGKTWRQTPAPVSVTLTGVRFIDARRGWAIGHRGVILATSDQGETWKVQLDGTRIAQAMARYGAALEAASEGGQEHRLLKAARQLASDGADKPWFDLHMTSAGRGLAVGAYGLAFDTVDGGAHWEPALARIDNPRSLHLYAIAGDGEHVYVAGEQGLLLQASGLAGNFARVETPYRGSYFAVAAMPAALVVAGLNGHAYRSVDRGRSWSKVAAGSAASFSAFQAAGSRLLLGDQLGNVYASADGGASFALLPQAAPQPLSAMALAADGTLTGVGLRGVTHLPAPGATQPQ
jgi:photosystem II stability/assembly factor-like uncharacterized protein